MKTTIPKIRRSEAGMTLLEVMLACAVVGVSLSLLFSSLIGLGAVGTLQADRARAAVVLAGTAEQLRTMSYTTLLAYTPSTITNGPGASCTLTLSCYNAAGTAVSLPIVGAAPANLPNPLEVKAQLVWLDKRGRAYTSATSALLAR